MLNTIIKLIVLVGLLLFVAWGGVCVYSNFIASPATPDRGVLDTAPKLETAPYSIYIENSGNLLYAKEVEQQGTSPGSRIFILHGFWELRGQKFNYKKIDIVLNEKIFGKITVEKRK